MSTNSPSKGCGTHSTFTWGEHDDAEYNRMAVEMNDDMKIQFTLFTFGITASTAIVGLLVTAGSAGSFFVAGLPNGAFFLLPLIVLIPTSLLILNRARTRNRKVSYIVVNFDYKRLLAEGVNDRTPIADVRALPFIPWETALHILDRTHLQAKKRVHLAPALKYMAVCYLVIELLCIGLAWYISNQADWLAARNLMFGVGIVAVPALLYRFFALMQLRNSTSIQGYIKNWLIRKYGSLKKAPQYLQDLVSEYEGLSSKPGRPHGKGRPILPLRQGSPK